ncbi:patatin-like phospholipase family protein [Clostridium sp. Marseille-P2415]|uniref:patatin-like phospholipase family protein n=1 Tax=Clostridium sp. Marseille-P2415 TaxID=1805471 RepID=UPI0009886DAB|nr:patatin-like phospholipase family protein [Clostridium sp. Marseille-P2415]
MDRAGLILEGGGTRGVFSAGVLDYFMEQELYLPYVIGVSAGAGIGANYVSRQHGRIKKTMIDYLRENSYLSIKHLIRKGCFDMIPLK